MIQSVRHDSLAVIASDNDIFLFCDYALVDNFELNLFQESELNSFLQTPNNFTYVFMDMPTAKRAKENDFWNSLCQKLRGRFFILTTRREVVEFFHNFSKDAETMPYPFTQKTLFSVLNKSKKKPRRYDFKIARNLIYGNEKFQENIFPSIPEFDRLVGSSEKMIEIKEKILLVADTDTPLIFFGESGTGKTVTAQIVHDLSRRKGKPFVVANMANGNKEIMESNLFGSVRGAFTDAKDREGLFRKADGGTLFMDEIAELSLECQAKLLRVIETGSFRPLGSDDEVNVDVRLIFATNADLEEMVKLKTFREDLYWRIVDFPIEVPALRERAEDIPALIEHTLNEIKSHSNMNFTITESAIQKLCTGEWPGNFRQFKACIRRAALISRYTGVIDQDAIIF